MQIIRLVVVGAVAVSLPNRVFAQDDPKTHPGSLSTKPDVGFGKALPAGPQRTAALAEAQAVLDVLRADAALTSPIGYAVVVKRLASARLPGDAPGMPYHAAVLGAINYFGWQDNGRGGKEIGPTGGVVPFHVAINTFGDQGEIESTDEELDHGPRILYDLKETGTFRGRPVYNGACTYISHRPVAPLIPLTKERYYKLQLIKARADSAKFAGDRAKETSTPAKDALARFLHDRPEREAANRKMIESVRTMGGDTAAIRQMTQVFAETEKQQEAGLRAAAAGDADQKYQEIIEEGRQGQIAHIAELQATLDGMSPDEKKAPSYLIDHGRGLYTPGNKGDDDWLLPMQPNPAFYDQSIAPSVPQLLWICLPGLQGVIDSTYQMYAGDEQEQEKRTAERRLADAIRIRDKLNWPALEALVKP